VPDAIFLLILRLAWKCYNCVLEEKNGRSETVYVQCKALRRVVFRVIHIFSP